MPPIPKQAQTEDSTTFAPDDFFDRWAKEELTPPWDNNLRMFIIKSFGLPLDDDYEYVAIAQVSLLQAQTYVEFGGNGGLHAWYRDDGGEVKSPPSATDIAAYIDIFRSSTSTSKALTALNANAKKDSIRQAVALHLQSLHKPAPASNTRLNAGKSKRHVNPAFDVWTWTAQNLEWGGPEPNTGKIRMSHAILPIMYHHFGCVCPSYESLAIIRQAAAGRRVIDMGSGNGYWTYMLRRLEAENTAKKGAKRMEVVPVDNGLSEWRTMWVGDTIQAEGDVWLTKQGGCRDDVLLLVYPSVGNDFTGRMIKSYKGSTIISAGSQNSNGYTGFAKETLPQWMARELPDFEHVLQIPLPSFAGKDEALFVFEKKDTGANEIK